MCCDLFGNVYSFDLVGIEYGPIIVTAVDRGDGLTLRCPACLEHLPLKKRWLGEEITCPCEGCEGRMRVNRFVVKPPHRARRSAFSRR